MLNWYVEKCNKFNCYQKSVLYAVYAHGWDLPGGDKEGLDWKEGKIVTVDL